MLPCVDAVKLERTVSGIGARWRSFQWAIQCSVCGSGDARVLEGHSFIVGAAVSIGGRDIKPGINVYRFANRIPLLFEVWCKPRCKYYK